MSIPVSQIYIYIPDSKQPLHVALKAPHNAPPRHYCLVSSLSYRSLIPRASDPSVCSGAVGGDGGGKGGLAQSSRKSSAQGMTTPTLTTSTTASWLSGICSKHLQRRGSPLGANGLHSAGYTKPAPHAPPPPLLLFPPATALVPPVPTSTILPPETPPQSPTPDARSHAHNT